MDSNKPILVTGASGYIGGHLISLLLARGQRVRCLARNPERLRSRAWFFQVEIINADVLIRENLDRALQGISTAYYMIHSMASGMRYYERDISAAHNFAAAASASGVEHIIYLGGLADPVADIGRHLRSRLQTGDALRQGIVPVTEFRASPIIGPGSTAFEMIRYLTERLPILVGPRWLYNRVQPVAIQNVLEYLLAAMERPTCRGQIYEIGGQDVISYAEMILTYARLRSLERRLLVLPGLPIWLMAFLVDKLTPIPAIIARPLIEGLRGDSVVRDRAARRVFPDIQPIGYPLAISTALKESPSALVRSSKRDEINQPVRRRKI